MTECASIWSPVVAMALTFIFIIVWVKWIQEKL